MEGPMMKCGHIANSYKVKGDKKIPGCVICNCFEVAESKPSLEGRTACCVECHKTVPSSWNLLFFCFREGLEFDSYYCGCHGWD